MCAATEAGKEVFVAGKGSDCQSLVPKNLNLGRFRLKSVCVNSF